MSYCLLAVLSLLMLIDFRQTVAGLRRGLVETNPTASAALNKFGAAGLGVHSLVWFAAVAALVLAFPSQWAAPFVAILSVGSNVAQNAYLLTRDSDTLRSK